MNHQLSRRNYYQLLMSLKNFSVAMDIHPTAAVLALLPPQPLCNEGSRQQRVGGGCGHSRSPPPPSVFVRLSH